MKTHSQWPARRFDQINRDAIDTRPVVTNGCTQKGRFVDQPMPAECGTELGAEPVNRRDVDLSHIFPLERCFRRWPMTTWLCTAILFSAMAWAAQ